MEVQEFENGAVLGGKHIVTYDRGADGGTLNIGSPLPSLLSSVKDTYDLSKADIGGVRLVEGFRIKDWGTDNQAPLRLDEAIKANQILPSLLDTKRKIILGKRLYMYYERWENDANGTMKLVIDEEPMPAEIEDFMLESESHRYFHQAAAQLVRNGNVITEFIPPLSSSISKIKYSRIKAHKAKFWRKEEQDTEGVVNNALFKGDAWAKSKRTNSRVDFKVKKVQLWNGMNDTDLDSGFVYWTGDDFSCPDDYYFDTIWAGSLTWGNLMNITPVFHANNLDNSYMPSFHIRIRKGMFLDPRYYSAFDQKEKQKYLDEEAQNRAAWLAETNAVLAGIENAGRVIWSEEEPLKGLDKKFPDVEIIPLDANMKDEVLLKLYEVAQKAVMSSVQIHPTIANIETAGKLSSGSEMRNATLMQRLIHTPLPRQILLEPIYLKARIDKWNEKHAKNGRAPKFGFEDEDIVALSADKTGTQTNQPSGV